MILRNLPKVFRSINFFINRGMQSKSKPVDDGTDDRIEEAATIQAVTAKEIKNMVRPEFQKNYQNYQMKFPRITLASLVIKDKFGILNQKFKQLPNNLKIEILNMKN